ncbi:MAG: hypothetical protein ACQGQP_04350 [Desulfovibrio sp.]
MAEPFVPGLLGRCPEDMCRGCCPYRDPEMSTPEGRAFLMDRGETEGNRTPHVVHVRIQPEDVDVDIPRWQAKNAGILLATLGLRQGTAIVACGRRLLTPDVPLYPSQRVLVRKVMSSG